MLPFYPDSPFGSSGKARQPAYGTDGYDRKATLLASLYQGSTSCPMDHTVLVLVHIQSPIPL